MKKICNLLLLFLLLIAISATGVVQIPSLQKKCISTLLKKSPTQLSYNTCTGFFPLRVTFTDLTIEAKEISLFAQEATCRFALLPILFKSVTILDLEAKNVDLITCNKNFSSSGFPLSLQVDHFLITNLHYQGQALDIEGNCSVDKRGAFSLAAKGTINDIRWDLIANRDCGRDKIALAGNLLYSPYHAQLFFSGEGKENFSGNLYADAKIDTIKLALISSWKSQGSQLLLPDLKLLLNKASLQASLRYDLEDGKLGIFGKIMNEPFTLQTVVHKKDQVFSLNPAILQFLDNEISLSCFFGKDDYNLTLLGKFAKIERTQQLFSHLLDYNKPLKGDLFLDLQLQKNAATFSANVADFQLQSYCIPKGCIKGGWKKNNPIIVNLTIDQFSVDEPSCEILPAINIRADAQLTEKHFLLKGAVEGLGEELFFLNCELPFTFYLRPFHFSLDWDAPFTASLMGKGRIDPLLSFLENYNLVIQGEMDCELTFFGTLHHPLSQGHLSFKGSLHEVTTDIFLEEVDAKILAENKEITIEKLHAYEKTQGKVEIQGKATLEKNLPLFLQITGHSLPLFGFEPLYAKTDFFITIEGTLDQLYASGHATLLEAEYHLQKTLTTKVPQMTLTYLFPKEKPPEKKSLLPLNLDIQIIVPSNLVIKGNGFDTQWSGEMWIKGTIQNPLCFGTLQMQKGRLEFARHIFYLTEGEILIETPSSQHIHLNIRGETDACDIVVFFQASGTVGATEINFTSSPPLSLQSIFSKLLFDSDLNELTPFQACRLAKFLVGLSSMNSSISKFQSIKESIGIDVFDITHCDFDTYDFTFQVGKYISQGTYVGINKSISGNFDEIEIQTRLFREFYLEGNFGGSLNGLTPNGGKIIFKWYRSY